MTFLDSALALADAGFRVFPLAPGTKIPAFERDWQKIATSDKAAITDIWTDAVTGWQQPYNIGVALSADVLVVDVDVRDGKLGAHSLRLLEALYDPLPETYTTTTASGGQHRYFRIKDIPAVGKILANGIDLKTAGGYVVGAGSVIGTGSYTAAGDPTRLAELPQPFVELARRSERPAPTAKNVSIELDSNDAISRAIDYLTREAPDAGTYKVAAKVKDYGVSEAVAVDLLCEHWAEARSLGKDRDHIAVRVANAYTYGKSPPGIASPEAEFEVVDINAPPGVENVGLFEWTTKQTYLVRGLLNYGMIGFLTGLPNMGKSPLALDLGVAIAKGEPWQGMKLKRGYVLYVATEGWTGIRNRFEALRREYGLVGGGIPFDFVARSLDLRTSSKDAKEIAAIVAERAAHFGLPPALVVIDTLSHAMVGASDADDEAARAAVKNLKILARTGAAVLPLHHPTKNASSSLRGSSVWSFDTDLVMEITTKDANPDNRAVRTLTTPRTKEFAQIVPKMFRIKEAELGKTDEGDPITSVVIDWSPVEFENKVPQGALDMLATLRDLQGDLSDLSEGVSWSEWLETCGTEDGTVPLPRRTAFRWRATLCQNQLISKTKGNRWVAVDSATVPNECQT